MIDTVTQISLIPRDIFLHKTREVSGERRAHVCGMTKQIIVGPGTSMPQPNKLQWVHHTTNLLPLAEKQHIQEHLLWCRGDSALPHSQAALLRQLLL